MLFLFGGVPEIYFDRLVARATKQLAGDFFTGLPLYQSPERGYRVDGRYCANLVATLVRFVEGRPQSLEKGLGVVLLLREWEREGFDAFFWPFALCKTECVRETISRAGIGAERSANVYATTALSAANALRQPVRAVTSEFATRLRRTPLLLPLRHFDSHHLQTLLEETWRAATNRVALTEAIRAVCARFEASHPFARRGRGGIFENLRGVQFAAPGRNDFHGKRSNLRTDPHNNDCFLNARVRLGGSFADGFHYDCTRGKSNYEGVFKNCHDAEAHYMGKPHLNVFPNDFIR
jgi:hypothetical protein